MNILVLGANSFSGEWFCRVAEEAGHHVGPLNRPMWDLRDVKSTAVVEKFISIGYKLVVNYAAMNVVATSWEQAPEYYDTNVAGVARIAESLLLAGVRKFVQVSTPEVYGSTGDFLKEGAAFNPSTPYAISRAAIDWHLRLLHKEAGLPVCFTRTVNVYGEGQQPYRIVPRTAKACLSGGKVRLEGGGVSTRSFIHAQDAARATLLVLEDGRPGEDYHIAHPKQVKIRRLVEGICELLDRDPKNVIEDAPERVGKDMNYQLDDSKIRSELGWCETISLLDGLKRTIEWFKFQDLVAEMSE